MAVNESGVRIWSPYKEILQHVISAVVRREKEAFLDLEMTLRRNKTIFINLLLNPPQNATNRNAVIKAETVGLPLIGQQGTQTLSRQFIDETLIISDLFSIDEYAAVELLISGEDQKPLFSGLTRGMIATLLYYDGRASIAQATKLLFQARDGYTWAMGAASDDITSLVTKFTTDLMGEGLFERLLTLLSNTDVPKEIHNLNLQSALGPPRHRRQVIDKIHEVENNLAECIFCWSCQSRIGRSDLLRLLRYLSTNASLAADMTLDRVTLTLLMAALYALDVRILEQDDSEDHNYGLPIVADNQFIKELHEELMSDRQWVIPGVKALLQFAWSLTLLILDQFYLVGDFREFSDKCEQVVDTALDNGVLQFLKNSVIASEYFCQEEYFVKQIHLIVTDFLSLMPIKVKEMRNVADEVSRVILANQQAGLEPPADLPRHFETLLFLIGDLYITDPLELNLGVEFWYPTDAFVQPSARPSQKQVNLFKFIRLSGDLLLPPLFISYLHMLQGLANSPQGARHCFGLLMNNNAQPGSTGCSVSWHHFFTAFTQYFSNLRQETPVASDLAHVYHYPTGWRGITPQEADGMVAVLRLIKTILVQDETACLALVENQQWMPIVVILGLVGCSVPPNLKAELLHVLAAFCRTPDIASNMWLAIESAQLLPTGGDLKTKYNKGGLMSDLDEVEPSLEEYPMTLAFLSLMDALTNYPLPSNVGRGYRQDGFEPYLEFIRTTILYKFLTRAYKDPCQKWEVGAAVFKLFTKILHVYEVTSDFTQMKEFTGRITISNSAGFSLMTHLLTDSQTLKLVLFLIDEGTKLLDKYAQFPGKKALEALTLYCLKLLESVLLKQADFISITQEIGHAVMISSLDKLLMNINPRSGKPDHLVNISRFVTYNAVLTHHALTAVKVLCLVVRSSTVPLPLLTGNEMESNELRHGFVESLECEDAEDVEAIASEGGLDVSDDDVAHAKLTCALRQQILMLLIDTLDQPAPNFAHFLLGFDVRKSINKTVLQDPGIMDTPRSCLHSLLLIANRGFPSRQTSKGLVSMPATTELAYHLVYMLCANKDTSGPVMRYLRSTDDFFYKHLQKVPCNISNEEVNQENVLTTLAQSWLLRCVAVELRVTSLGKQRSHLQRLITLLAEDAPLLSSRGMQMDKTSEFDLTRFDSSFNRFGNKLNKTGFSLSGNRSVRKIVSILEALSLVLSPPSTLRSELFPINTVMQLAVSCEQVNEFGVKFINVKAVRKSLANFVASQPGWSVTQRAMFLKEIKDICEQITTHNAYLQILHARSKLLEGWRLVTETLLAVCPGDALPQDTKPLILLEVLQLLLLKASDPMACRELATICSGSILTLMAHLQESLAIDSKAATFSLDSTILVPHVNSSLELFGSPLKAILRQIINLLLKSGGESALYRAHIYGALLYCLHVGCKPSQVSDANQPLGFDWNEKLNLAKYVTQEGVESSKLLVENLAILSSYGESIIDTIFHSACDGHDMTKMLALSVLNMVVSIDRRGEWLNQAVSKGYLQHIVDSLYTDDQELQLCLAPQPDTLKAIYIFEAKMSFLTRLCESAVGANFVLRAGVMTKLAACYVFGLRPNMSTDRPTMDGFIPSIAERYRHHILFPVLRLCLSCMTTLGIENTDVTSAVLRFVIAHLEVFCTILRNPLPTSMDQLTELCLASAVVSRAALNEASSDITISDSVALELRGQVVRLRRHIVATLQHFDLVDRLRKQLVATETGVFLERLQVANMLTSAVESISNVVTFCRALLTRSSVTGKDFTILFSPNMDMLVLGNFGADGSRGHPTNVTVPQSLGLLVAILKQIVTQFFATVDALKQLQHKIDTVNEMTAEELKQWCKEEHTEQRSSLRQQQELSKSNMLLLAKCRSRELDACAHIIENCIYMLWRHLEYYLLYCVPGENGISLYQLNMRRQTPRRLQVSGPSGDDENVYSQSGSTGVLLNIEDMAQLKKEAANCLNEPFTKRLIEVEQMFNQERSHHVFIEALVRRIRRILLLTSNSSM